MNYKRLLVLLLSPILFLSACHEEVLTRSNMGLDTIITITLYSGGREEILDKAFETIERYDTLLDPHDPNGVIAKINEEGVVLPEEIYSLLEENINYNKLTDNAFNPTLGSLIDLWDIGEPVQKEAPSSASIQEALSSTSIQNLVLDPTMKTARVLNINTRVNLGASAKGFLADILKNQLIESGVKKAIINLGGNIVTIDSSSTPFHIGIDNPDIKDSNPIAVLEETNASIVTSGNYQRYFTDSSGKRYHHILDPKTGYPAETNLDEVIVVSDSSLEGDILSTAFFVMGKDQAINFLKKNKDFANIGVIFVESNKNIWVSSNLESKFTLEPNFSDTYQLHFFK